MGELLSKLKLGKHYRMERFAVLSGAFSVMFILVIIGCFGSQMAKNADSLTDEALYSTEFQSSRTGISGTVEGVYVSQDRTRSLVLGHFEDIKSISTNADNYQMFLTAVNQDLKDERLKAEPSGAFYVFGNTGYFGTYLVNSEGFEPQILDLTVRCNAEYIEATFSEDTTGDASFAKYDQFKIYFNPGGAKATVAACLSGADTPTPVDIYAELVVDPQEKEVREAIESDEAAMQRTLAKIADLTDEATRDDIVVEAPPALIAGDEFIDVGTDGAPSYVYKCETVVPGGYDFDWRDGSVSSTGYLKSLLGENETATTLFTKKSQEAKVSDSTTIKREWFLTDGSALASLLSGPTSDLYQDKAQTIQNLESAWSEYISTKQVLQTKDLRELLVLESSLSNINQTTTINTDKNVLLCY